MLYRMIFTVGFFTTFLIGNAQNVGIGTTNPVNKLTVDGKVNITDSLGIGTSMPESILDIESLGTAGDAGQVKLMAPNMTNTSFTRYAQGRNSTIGNKIEWRFDYSGNGNQWNAHTFGFSGLQPFVAFSFNQRVGIGTLTPSNKLSVVGNADITGNLGIGTTAPAAKLDIAGNIKITDGSQGAGKVLTSDANGLASWATPASNNSWTLTGNSGTSAANNFIGTTDNRSLRFRTNNNQKMIIDSLGNVGIGTSAPGGLLHIKSISNSSGANDQQQTVVNGVAGSNTQWQSFTAGITGQLYQVDLLVNSTIYNWYQDGTIKIYSGEGNGGTLLSTTNATFYFYNTPIFQLYSLSTLVNVTAGNKYTIEFSVIGMSVLAVHLNDNNPYSGGITSYGSGTDFCFKTYVKPLVDALFVSDGKVGIGSTNPSAKLEVAGTLKIVNGSQGAGKVLTSDANGLATWATPASNNSWALTGNSGTTAAANFIGTTDNRSLRFRTNNNQRIIIDSLGRVGIGTNNPAANMHIKTGALVCDDATQRFFVNGNYKWDIAGFASSYEISRSGVAVDFYIDGANGNVGMGTSAPTAKLSVNGAANNTTGSWGVFSDARIKTINKEFTDGLSVINKIRPVKFNYNEKAPFKADGEQIGVIAQELEQIAPYMVSQKQNTEIKDLREVNNQAYVFLLINAVKELSAQNEQLKTEIDAIKKQNVSLRSVIQTTNAQNIERINTLEGKLEALAKTIESQKL